MAEQFINGSDMLVSIGNSSTVKAVGHCTSHSVTMNTETKDRAFKPAASANASAGLWKNKGVTGLNISIKADGLIVAGETENGFEQLSAMWGVGQSVEVKCFKRGTDSAPYIKGKFIIDSFEETFPGQDDSTYSISLSNDGEPDIYPGKTGSATPNAM